jgi:hypothetical protein
MQVYKICPTCEAKNNIREPLKITKKEEMYNFLQSAKPFFMVFYSYLS